MRNDLLKRKGDCLVGRSGEPLYTLRIQTAVVDLPRLTATGNGIFFEV